MTVRAAPLIVAALLLAACQSSTEPSSATSATPAPTLEKSEPEREIEATTSGPPDDSGMDVSNGDIEDWCERWYADVVDARAGDTPETAVGAAFILAAEGVDSDDELISTAAEVIDYKSGADATADQVEQAINDIELACAAYITFD